MAATIIIGNGISGTTLARELRKKSDEEIIIISEETPYFFSRTALMYVYMGQLKFEHTQPYENNFWAKNNLKLRHQKVIEINSKDNTITLDSNETLPYKQLILALGSSPNRFNYKNGISTLYFKQDLEELEQKSDHIKTAVIVGGGLIGVELAEMLKHRGKEVIFLVREPSFWRNALPKEESELVTKEIQSHGIDLRFSTELKEVNNKGQVITKTGEVIDCQYVGLTAGVSPAISLLESSPEIKTNRGVLINEYFQTSVPNIYAIGDCAEHISPPKNRRNLEQIWYTGRIMAEQLAENLVGNQQKYDPGIFFNSAKFFEIEYQTYGQVDAKQPEGVETYLWQSQANQKLVRINYLKDTEEVIGVNTFGIRMRHTVWEKWISSQRKIDYVIANLKEANFDPEFYKRYENTIIADYNKTRNKSITIKKRWFNL